MRVIPDLDESSIIKSNPNLHIFSATATFLFDRRLNLIKEKELKAENQQFFDALRVLTFKSFEILMLPRFILRLFPSSRSPTVLTNKAWDTVFALGTYLIGCLLTYDDYTE